MTTTRTAVILVAAGSGTRLGAAEPKAFAALGNRTILDCALDAVFSLEDLAAVIVVAPKTHLGVAEQIVAPRAGSRARVVPGGDTRQQSVAAGLAALAELETTEPCDVVLVHDAARALTPYGVFARVRDEVLRTGQGVVPVVPVSDTIKAVDPQGFVTRTHERSALRRAQTPQGFLVSELRQAYADAREEYTDDAALFAAQGRRVRVVDGDEVALKITTPEDLRWAQLRLTPSLLSVTEDFRVGTGMDAHAFAHAQDVPLWLAGLEWPDEQGLEGHSDGDVACHALVDALLGAAQLGDIGMLFGTSEPAYQGARGEVFVREARARVEAAGWRIVNASVEIVGNRPRLSQRRVEAEARLESMLEAPVNLAATTSDGLGLTGEGRGIGAIASVLLARVG